MKTRDLILAWRKGPLSAFASGQNYIRESRLIMLCSVVVLFSIFFLPTLLFAQDDTLILLGSCPGLNQASGVSAYNKHAFVVDWDNGLWAINYVDPHNPFLVTTYPGWALDVEIKNNLAYYVGNGALYIRDISNPLESEIVGSCGGWWWDHLGFKVHLFDSLAIVLHTTSIEYCILKIIDIFDPTNPQVLSSAYPEPEGTMHWGDAYKSGNYAYWADRAYIYETGEDLGRIIVLDITDPANPSQIVVDTCLPSFPWAIWIKNDYAYVALGKTYEVDQGGLMVLDISDPYSIDSMGFFEIPGTSAINVCIKDKYAYVSVQEGGIYVLDITNPINPTLVTYYDTPGISRDVFVDEPYVLVVDYTSLLVFEASFLQRMPGDINEDGTVNLGDVVFLISYLYKQGSPPDPIELGDINGNCVVDLGDVVYLISYLYKDGPAPLTGCASYKNNHVGSYTEDK